MIMVLLVEDDKNLSNTLLRAFSGREFVMQIARTVHEARQALNRNFYEMVILDRGLPDGDGADLIPEIQDHWQETKIIVFSQLGDSEERILGLDAGADDYLTKPLSLAELRLRIERWANVFKKESFDYFQIRDVKLYPRSGQLQVAENSMCMRRKEAEILSCLFKHKNRTVTRDMLIEWVWNGDKDIPTYATIDVYLRRIRLLLGDRGDLIQTVRGFGYMLRE